MRACFGIVVTAIVIGAAVAGGCNGKGASDGGEAPRDGAAADRAGDAPAADLGPGDAAPDRLDQDARADAGADGTPDADAPPPADAGPGDAAGDAPPDASARDAGAETAPDAPADAAPPDRGPLPDAGPTPCGPGELRWAALADYQAPSTGHVRGMDMVLFPGGDFAIAGMLSGRITFGHAPNPTFAVQGSSLESAFVARYAEDGTARWASVWGTTYAYVYAAAALPDGAMVAVGLFQGQLAIDAGLPTAITLTAPAGANDTEGFIVKVGADGRAVWARRLSAEPTAVAANPGGGMTVTGRFGGTTVFGAGEPNQTTLMGGGADVFVAQLDAGGALRWVRGGAGPGNLDQPNGVAVLPDGAAVVVGNVSLPAVFQGATAAEAVTLPGTVERTYFLARYSASGALEWVRGADQDSVGQRVALAPDGAIVTTGSLLRSGSLNAGRPDAARLDGPTASYTFLARHGADGSLRSLARIGALWGPFAIAVRDDGAVLLGGQLYYQGNLDVGTGVDRLVDSLGWEDGYALCAAPTGSVGWIHIASGNQHDNVWAIRIRPDGDALFAGTFTASIGVDRGTDQAVAIPAMSYQDTFVARTGR